MHRKWGKWPPAYEGPFSEADKVSIEETEKGSPSRDMCPFGRKPENSMLSLDVTRAGRPTRQCDHRYRSPLTTEGRRCSEFLSDRFTAGRSGPEMRLLYYCVDWG